MKLKLGSDVSYIFYSILFNIQFFFTREKLSGLAEQFATQFGGKYYAIMCWCSSFEMQNRSLAYARLLICYTFFLGQIILRLTQF